ncbi:odorant receptor 13a-like [Halyomorpha halys]|uniref:odorant receptor 13a-like n=1 Tax=Halyomorpha halys TaxID=286706 RepID=UPI0034D1553F
MWKDIKAILKEKIEQAVGKALMENQGIYMVISGVYPVNIYYSLTAILCQLFTLSFFMYTCIYFYYNEYNLSMFSEAAHFVVVVFCSTSFYIIFWFRKDKVHNITKLLEQEIFKYKGTLDLETRSEIDEMTLKMKNRKNKISNIMTIVYIICGLFGVILLPIIFKKSAITVKEERILLTVPVATYYPVRGDFGWYLCSAQQYLTTFFIISALNGSDVAFSCYCEEGCNQLRILCHAIRHSLRRARYLHTHIFGKEPLTLRDETFAICLKMCLDESVMHHYRVIRYFKEIQSLFSWCIMIVMMAGASMLCLCGIYFFFDVVGFGTKISFAFYLSGELMHTFIYAWYGQQISEMSAEIREVLYEIDWEDCSKTVKPYILIMQAYTNNPIKLKGGDFMEYNLNTFGNVCSTAYSYFNLMSAAVPSSS